MCQIVTGVNKADNITRARAMIELAAHHGANIVVLPVSECCFLRYMCGDVLLSLSNAVTFAAALTVALCCHDVSF